MGETPTSRFNQEVKQMAFVGLKVDDGTKALWVEAADGENMSLSAWLKAAAADRLKGDQPVVLQVPIEEIAKVVETMTPGQSLSDAVDTSAPTNKHVEPAIEDGNRRQDQGGACASSGQTKLRHRLQTSQKRKEDTMSLIQRWWATIDRQRQADTKLEAKHRIRTATKLGDPRRHRSVGRNQGSVAQRKTAGRPPKQHQVIRYPHLVMTRHDHVVSWHV